MIEDTQLGKMSQQNNSNNTASVLLPKKNGGGNTQLDNFKVKGKDALFLGVSKPQKTYKKASRGSKQYNTSRREQSFTKNPKKVYLAAERNLPVVTSSEDTWAPQDLLNFQYAPLQSFHRQVLPSSGRHGVKYKRNATYNKEAFIQANCHFVVDESQKEKYLVNTVDPDVLVEWQHILLVYLPTHEIPECPICLYPPKAAKMTRCGHVFCWCCILHYLKLSDKNWRKCPICHEAVHEHDLKSVVLIQMKKYAKLENITMRLMRRSKDSLIALPANEWDLTKTNIQTWNDNCFKSSSKLMLGSSNAVIDHLLLKEQAVLEAQLTEAMVDESGDECFIKLAMESVKRQIELYNAGGKTAEVSKKDVKDEKSKKIYGDDGILASMLEEQGESDGEYAFSENDDEDDLAEETQVSKQDWKLSEKDYAEREGYDANKAAQQTEGKIEGCKAIGALQQIEGCEAIEALQQIEGCEAIEAVQELEYFDEIRRVGGRHRDYSESASSETSCSGYANSSPNKKLESYHFYQAVDGQNIFIHSLNARCIIEEYGSLDQGPQGLTGQIIDFECFTMTKELRKRFRYLRHLPLSCEFIICELLLRPPVLSRHTIKNFMPEFKKRKAARLKKIEEQRKFDRRASAARNRQEGYRVEDEDNDNIPKLDLNDQTDFPANFSPPQTQNTVLEAKVTGPSFAQVMKDDSYPALPRRQTATRSVEPASTPPLQYTASNVGYILKNDSNADDDDGTDVVAPSFKEMFSSAMMTTTVETPDKKSDRKTEGKKKKNKGMLLFATGAQRKY